MNPTTDFRGSRVIHSARIVDGDGSITDDGWVRNFIAASMAICFI